MIHRETRRIEYDAAINGSAYTTALYKYLDNKMMRPPRNAERVIYGADVTNPGAFPVTENVYHYKSCTVHFWQRDIEGGGGNVNLEVLSESQQEAKEVFGELEKVLSIFGSMK